MESMYINASSFRDTWYSRTGSTQGEGRGTRETSAIWSDETWWADPLECHCFLRNRSSSHRRIVALAGKMEKQGRSRTSCGHGSRLCSDQTIAKKAGSVRIRRKAANREMLGRDGCEALGLGTPWMSENEDGRVAPHRRR